MKQFSVSVETTRGLTSASTEKMQRGTLIASGQMKEREKLMVDIGAEKKQCFDDYKNGTLDDLIIRMIDDVLENNDLQASPTVWYCLIGIKKMLSEQRWIPVSERLPKELLCDDGYIEPSNYVLVWGDCGNYGVSRYWGNRRSKSESPDSYKDWMDLDWVAQKPIAWMPLPRPWEGEKDD